MAPTPEARIDLFSPAPNLAVFTTINNYDAWWYYGAEYGGGSRTMQQDGGGKTQTDINDIRLTTGLNLDWLNNFAREHIGFIRLGLVFNRKVVFRDISKELRPRNDYNVTRRNRILG